MIGTTHFVHVSPAQLRLDTESCQGQTGKPNFRSLLMVNVIVLWNTICMDAVLNQLRAWGFDVRDKDVARLSPLGFGRINTLVRYVFILPDQIAHGELRPLRDPQNADDEDSSERSVPWLPDHQARRPHQRGFPWWRSN